MTRAVTERDFRKPEFRDANPEEYEFRSDGEIVRKDRWERAVHSIAFRVMPEGRRSGFEISDVVARVTSLVDDEESWCRQDDETFCGPDRLRTGYVRDIRLEDGSILTSAVVEEGRWIWRGIAVDGVKSWRDPKDEVTSAEAPE
jgi:hypothetical protein